MLEIIRVKIGDFRLTFNSGKGRIKIQTSFPRMGILRNGEQMSSIYVFYCNVSAKTYIGQQKNGYDRIRTHLSFMKDVWATQPPQSLFYEEMRKYPVPCWWYIDVFPVPEKDLNWYEDFFMNLYAKRGSLLNLRPAPKAYKPPKKNIWKDFIPFSRQMTLADDFMDDIFGFHFWKVEEQEYAQIVEEKYELVQEVLSWVTDKYLSKLDYHEKEAALLTLSNIVKNLDSPFDARALEKNAA